VQSTTILRRFVLNLGIAVQIFGLIVEKTQNVHATLGSAPAPSGFLGERRWHE
jgi:hypothetical protein